MTNRISGGPLAGARRWRLVPARANGQLAFGFYAWDDTTQTFTPRAIDVLTLRGAQVQEITVFLSPAAFRNFDLPRHPFCIRNQPVAATGRCAGADSSPAPAPAVTAGKPTDHDDHELRLRY